MTQQLELDFKSKAARAAKAKADCAQADADALIDHLRVCADTTGRLTAADHAEAMSWSDRRIRAAAEASNGRVLSAPGCIGYRLAERTSVASYHEIERPRYRSQIRIMLRRMLAMDRAVHATAGKS
jgi:hypothetical protein